MSDEKCPKCKGSRIVDDAGLQIIHAMCGKPLPKLTIYPCPKCCPKLHKAVADEYTALRRQLAQRDETIEQLVGAVARRDAIIAKLPKNWGDNTDTPKAVRDILAYWLRANGYDGLCNSDMECGCSLDDLIPCDSPCEKCEAGYQGPSPDSSVDFFMYPTQAAAEAAQAEQGKKK